MRQLETEREAEAADRLRRHVECLKAESRFSPYWRARRPDGLPGLYFDFDRMHNDTGVLAAAYLAIDPKVLRFSERTQAPHIRSTVGYMLGANEGDD